jgi:hypothetical protein
MRLTLTTYPTHTLLVDVPQLRRELGLSEEADNVLAEQARQVSAAIRTYCQQSFWRAGAQETFDAQTWQQLLLSYTPVVQLVSVTQDGSPVLDVTVLDADAGAVRRAPGWGWGISPWWPSAGVSAGWALLDTLLVQGALLPQVVVNYIGGYLLPEDDVVSTSIAVDGPAKTFTLSTGTWPLLAAGDRITTLDFTTAGNNGTWTVVTRTATVVTVSEAGLTTEAEAAAGGNPKTVRVRTIPDDILRAAADTLKAWYIGRERDPIIASRAISGLSISYAQASVAGDPYALPPSATAQLAPYRRHA